MKRKRIVIAGGGTGGHIYPALSIAQSLQRMDPEVDVQFVGSPSGLERKIIPPFGFSLHLIPIGKLNYSGALLKKIGTLFRLPFGFLKAAWLLFRLRPMYVLGVGGYASGPFLLAASLFRKRTALWEPNAHPGMTNRWLSYFVSKAFVVFDDARKELHCKDIYKVGIPVRADIEKVQEKERREGEPTRVLIFGGSQGARAINTVVQQMLLDGGDWLKDFVFVHQTGTADFESVKEKMAETSDRITVFEYLNDMPQRYQWADIVVARSGASTVAEIAAQRKVAIFIPLPWAADNHQQKNAEALVHDLAGLLILQKDLTPETLKKSLLDLRQHPEKRQLISDRVKRFHQPQAGDELAKIILKDLH